MTYTIKTNASLHAIAAMFEGMGRKDQFSLQGIEAIMGYLEDCSEDGSIDLDVIAICCDFTESSIEDIVGNHGIEEEYCLDEDGEIDAVLVYYQLQDNTWATLLDNGNILYVNY